MQTTTVDPLTRFLRQENIETKAIYFEETDFFLGWKVVFKGAEITYRLEEHCLLICNLASQESHENGVMAFILFIRWIQKKVPEVLEVRGAIFPSEDSELDEKREHLARLLERQGAEWVQDEKDAQWWLSYRMH